MKIEKPKNVNYCATVVELSIFNTLEKCDNVKGAIIFGNQIIVSKDAKEGDKGLYFPVETKLSPQFLSNNNLYRKPELNIDKEKKGYFEENGRIRCMKFRGHKSEGFFIELHSLNFIADFPDIKIGTEFDILNDIPICEKYVSRKNPPGTPGGKKGKKKIKESKILRNQFSFHPDTAQLAKNLHKIDRGDFISIAYKIHGTSVIISKVLCKKKINWFYKILRFLGIKIIDYEYDNIYSSRRVIKNDIIDMNKLFYDIDIWGLANNKLKEYLKDGMTIYAEIAGFLPNGGYIQKPFDYGCDPGTFELYIYRITYTNMSGDVFEFSYKQMKDWCEEKGLKVVPCFFYGQAYDLFDWEERGHSEYYDNDLDFGTNLLNVIKTKYLEKDCYICKNKVPAEGIVLRPEKNEFEAFKAKSFKFLEMESKQLDNGENDIEEQLTEEEI